MNPIDHLLSISQQYEETSRLYMNRAQLEANLVDSNILIAEIGRGGGKTDGITAPRTIRVAFDIPRETSVIAHTTYVALLANVIPNIIKFYKEPRGLNGEVILQEGIHYVVGKKDLPKHFAKPIYSLENPEHCVTYSTGHVLRPIATDRDDSIAGGNIVHAIVEEMKHNKGSKLKSRIFPALRTGLRRIANKSPYHGGLLGVSDTARLSVKEDDWFYEYEELVDRELITDIINTAIHIEKAKLGILKGKEVEKNKRVLEKWLPILSQQRINAVHYIRASSFINKDVLGIGYFANLAKTLSEDELLAAVCGVREVKVGNPFFAHFDEVIHTYIDSYIYDNIEKFNIANTFTITSEYLKYYDKNKPLLLGYDPGYFSSIVAAQEKRELNELRILKDFHAYSPQDQGDLAREVTSFFSSRGSDRIILYYDRAANQDKSFRMQRETDARKMKAELERRGWRVTLKNEGQRTIYHWEHYDLWEVLLSEEERNAPKIRICANECKNLVSSINHSPLKSTTGVKELDKSTEVKLPFQLQVTQSPQIATAAMYLVFGLYERFKHRRRQSSVASVSNKVSTIGRK